MRRLSLAVGLSLVYASAYYLPLLNPHSLYLVPRFFDYLVFPVLVAILVLTPLFFFGASAKVGAGVRHKAMFLVAVLLTIIAIKSVFDAAGLPLLGLLLGMFKGHVWTVPAARIARFVIVGISLLVAVLLIYTQRRNLRRWLHFLSTLGFAFAFLAVYRCLSGQVDVHYPAPATLGIAALPKGSALPARRVVWLIFDEMDARLSLGPTQPLLPNFAYLLKHGVSATVASSPGRDTFYSVPALLTASDIKGFAISRSHGLQLSRTDGQATKFDTSHSVFSRLPGGASSGSVLGFYHPYCRVLPGLHRCQSTYLGNAGRWFDSLLFFGDTGLSVYRFLKLPIAFLPEFVLSTFDPMYRVSESTVAHLDTFLDDQTSALSFIHLNFPHLPSSYAQRALQQRAANDSQAYRSNLVFADRILGKIVARLEVQAHDQNILLIVSSDHWLRTASAVPAPVPFIVWKVGDGVAKGQSVLNPFSTYHTGTLALDFLQGKLETQESVASFLERQAFSPTWMAPEGYKEY